MFGFLLLLAAAFAPEPPTYVPVCNCEVIGESFCNYDDGDSGFCENCVDIPGGTLSGCDQWGLPDAGAADCHKWCDASVAPTTQILIEEANPEEESEYTLKHTGGACSAGWIPQNPENQASVTECGDTCATRTSQGVGYFAFDADTGGCACYTLAGACPIQHEFPNHNSYSLPGDPKSAPKSPYPNDYPSSSGGGSGSGYYDSGSGSSYYGYYGGWADAPACTDQQKDSQCCETTSVFVDDPQWNFTSVGGDWTANKEFIRYDIQDDEKCGGNAAMIQTGTATLDMNFEQPITISLEMNGNVESQFEKFLLFVDDELAARVQADDTEDCWVNSCNMCVVSMPEKSFTVSPGQHKFRIEVSTIDQLYHLGAWFEIRFKKTDNDACHGCECIEPTIAPTHPPSYVGNFFEMSGDSCEVEGDCVSSGNYPSNHTDHEHCRITMLKDALVTPGAQFSLEMDYDHLTIGEEDIVTSDMIPDFLHAGQTFTWASDESVTHPGWKLCFSEDLCHDAHYACVNYGNCCANQNYEIGGHESFCTRARETREAHAMSCDTLIGGEDTNYGIPSDLFDRYDENLDKELTLKDLEDMAGHMHIYDEILDETDDNTLDLVDVESHTKSYDGIWDNIVQTIKELDYQKEGAEEGVVNLADMQLIEVELEKAIDNYNKWVTGYQKAANSLNDPKFGTKDTLNITFEELDEHANNAKSEFHDRIHGAFERLGGSADSSISSERLQRNKEGIALLLAAFEDLHNKGKDKVDKQTYEDQLELIDGIVNEEELIHKNALAQVNSGRNMNEEDHEL